MSCTLAVVGGNVALCGLSRTCPHCWRRRHQHMSIYFRRMWRHYRRSSSHSSVWLRGPYNHVELLTDELFVYQHLFIERASFTLCEHAFSTFFAPVTLTLTQWLSYTNLTRIPWRYTGRANMNFVRQGFQKQSSDRQTDTIKIIYDVCWQTVVRESRYVSHSLRTIIGCKLSNSEIRW